MNKDYKAKLLEKAGIYVDCCQLLKCVYKLLFSMPKKDRVIIGDKIIVDILSVKKDGVERVICSLNSYIGYIKNIEQKRRMWLFVEKALSKFKNVLYWNSEKNSFSTKELKHS